MAPPPSTATVTGRKSAKKPTAKPSNTKSAVVSKPRAHPTYYEMIKEAVVALKERTGSSQHAIAKFIEEKQKDQLPSNYKKLLSVQLKKLVASGKLTKVKNSFKLSSIEKAVSEKTKKIVADVKEKKPKKLAISVPKEKKTNKVSEKPVKMKKVISGKSPVKKTKSVKTPVKMKRLNRVKTPVVMKTKSVKTPVKMKRLSRVKSPVMKTKSVKTPVKKPETIRPPAKKAKK